jgi:hypothetical protein
MAGASDIPQRFPRLERVLAKYIAAEMRAGNEFYISADLNSDVLRGVNPDQIEAMYPMLPDPGGLGFLEFLIPIFTAIAGAAGTVGTAVAAAAPSIASIAGTVASIKAIDAANQHTASAGVTVPQSIAVPAVTAVKQDLLAGTGLSPTVLAIGAAGLLAVVLLTGRR